MEEAGGEGEALVRGEEGLRKWSCESREIKRSVCGESIHPDDTDEVVGSRDDDVGGGKGGSGLDEPREMEESGEVRTDDGKPSKGYEG